MDTNASKRKSAYPGLMHQPAAAQHPNSYFVENGTYVRMRNAQIGYTFKIPGLKKAGVQKLRIYVSATNLFTLTGYKRCRPGVERQHQRFWH
jgi:hypothetical protein